MTPTDTERPAPEERGSKSLADRLGVFAASACAVHCLAAPIVLAAAPLLGSAWASPRTHWIFAAVSIPAAVSLLIRNVRRSAFARRKAWRIGAFATVGILLILVGLVAPGTSWSQAYGVQLELPTWLSSLGAESGCQDECCASLHHASSGEATLSIPFASLVTMTGGLLLVIAHVSALHRCGSHAKA